MTLRRQLTLFVAEPEASRIEALRAVLDPVQHALIAAHLTLCREDEFEADGAMLSRLRRMRASPLQLQFGRAEAFHEHGILLPCVAGEADFRALRERALGREPIRRQSPHLTLAHPRNPRAPGNRLESAQTLSLPLVLRFEHLHLIEQVDGGTWQSLERFALDEK